MAKVGLLVVLAAPVWAAKTGARPFAKVGEREAFMRVIEAYANRDDVVQRVCCVLPDDLATMQSKYAAHLAFQGVQVTAGGPDWFGAAERGLAKLKDEVEQVWVHDGCCPAVPYTMLDALAGAVEKTGAAAPVLAAGGHLAKVSGSELGASGETAGMHEVQSPQAFDRKVLVEAYAKRAGSKALDDASLVRLAGGKVTTIAGSRYNVRADSEESVRLLSDAIKHLPRPKPKGPMNPFGEAEW